VSDFKLIRSETVRFLLGEEGDFKRVQGEGKFWWRNVLRNGVVGYHEADSEEMDKLIAENERLQARVAELECMVKVFRGCIDTQTLPGQGSRCHKKVYDLVGDPDDGGGCDA